MTAPLSMDSSTNERKLLLHCVGQLLALETALRSPKRLLSERQRKHLVLLNDLTDCLLRNQPLHPAIEKLTATDLIGYRMDEALSLIRKASSVAGESGQDTAPEGRGSPLETT